VVVCFVDIGRIVDHHCFVFKKPMMKVLPGSRNKTGQQQGNQNKGRGSQKNQRGRGGRNQQNKSGMFS
jgi:hypothetical protein